MSCWRSLGRRPLPANPISKHAETLPRAVALAPRLAPRRRRVQMGLEQAPTGQADVVPEALLLAGG